MAAAFRQFAPNLLENVKISCKSQVEEETYQSEELKSFELRQKNNLNTLKDHAEISEK